MYLLHPEFALQAEVARKLGLLCHAINLSNSSQVSSHAQYPQIVLFSCVFPPALTRHWHGRLDLTNQCFNFSVNLQPVNP